jgi:sporulation protein YlmC with PRC-barrel domain
MALIFSACAGDADDNNDGIADTPGDVLTDTVELTDTVDLTDTTDLTDTVDLTPTVELSATATAELTPTLAPTEPMATLAPTDTFTATETVTDTSGLTGTQALPGTGVLNPGLVSVMLDFDVYDQTGQKIGTTEDFLADVDTGEIIYLIVDLDAEFVDEDGNFTPVPWSLVDLANTDNLTGTPDTDSSTVDVSFLDYNAFVINVDVEVLSNAPHFALDEFPMTMTDARAVDVMIQTYWGEFLTLSVP